MSDDLAVNKKTGRELFQIHFHHMMEWGWKPEEVNLPKLAKYYKTDIPVVSDGLLIFPDH